MKAVVDEAIWRQRSKFDLSAPWIPAGTYLVERRFDDSRYLIRLSDSTLTLIRSDECELI